MWQFWLSDNFDSVGDVTILTQWQFRLDAPRRVVKWQFWLTWFLLQLDNFDSVTILTQLLMWQFWLSDNFDSVGTVRILTQWQFWLDAPRRVVKWQFRLTWFLLQLDNFDSVTILTQLLMWQFWLNDNFDSVGTVTILTQWQFWLDAPRRVVMWQFWLTWFLLQLDNFDSMTILTQLLMWQFWLSDNFDSMRRCSWWCDNFDSPGFFCSFSLSFFCSWTILTQWQFWLSWLSDNPLHTGSRLNMESSPARSILVLRGWNSGGGLDIFLSKATFFKIWIHFFSLAVKQRYPSISLNNGPTTF